MVAALLHAFSNLARGAGPVSLPGPCVTAECCGFCHAYAASVTGLPYGPELLQRSLQADGERR